MRVIIQFFKGFGKGLKEFGTGISTIVNSVLLLIVYIIGVGLTSVFAKLFGKHFLDLKKPKTKTYWKELNLKKEPIEKYYRQF
ncbi:hypothetical protein KY348_03965 [Candidatus Woesearchaeota archaeon]|nr:hypothetical protein [Candidatus Woesearchaeota archaeon]